MGQQLTLKLVHDAETSVPQRVEESDANGPRLLARVLDCGVIQGDSEVLLGSLPAASVDLFFTSPPTQTPGPTAAFIRIATSDGSCRLLARCITPRSRAAV